tara:strand:- start:575 stop:1804 length:1230 start_codon:yes stop_codon:yes gene_type:complete
LTVSGTSPKADETTGELTFMPYSANQRLSTLVGFTAFLVAGCTPQPSVETATIADNTTIESASGVMIEVPTFDDFVDRKMSELEIPGLSIAVISDGQIIYDAAKGVANLETGEPVTRQSVFEAASLSKPVFAYLVLKLADRGLLDIDRPLYQYRPLAGLENADSYHAVSTRMALSHRTGFPNWRWFDPAPPESGIERGTMYMKREPGEFGYSGEGYNYVSLVIADLTGTDQLTLDTVYQGEIAEPLNLSCSAFVRTDCVAARKVTGHKEGEVFEKEWPRSFPDDTPMTFGAAGRLHTNAIDYAKIMLAWMNEEGLSESLYDEFFAEQAIVPYDSDTHRATGVTAWGLGIAIEPTEFGSRYEHGGNNGDFQSGMMFFKDRRLGYVFFTNSDNGEEFNRRLEACLTFATCQ